MFVGLNVIGIRMTCERPRCEKRANICRKQKIENTSKNRKRKKRSVAPRRTRRMKGDRSRPFRKIGCKPGKWKVPYSKSYGETFQEDIMVHGVESSAHIKQSSVLWLQTMSVAESKRSAMVALTLARAPCREDPQRSRRPIVR